MHEETRLLFTVDFALINCGRWVTILGYLLRHATVGDALKETNPSPSPGPRSNYWDHSGGNEGDMGGNSETPSNETIDKGRNESFVLDVKESNKKDKKVTSTNQAYEAGRVQALIYVAYIVGIALGTSVLVIPPLLLPLAPADEGVMVNWVYFLFYNSIVSCYLTIASWMRLSKLCGTSPQYALVPVACMLGSLFFILGALPWEASLSSSYLMIYMAPVACTIFDVLFVAGVSAEELDSMGVTTGELMGMIATNYSPLTGLPVLLLFLPVVLMIWNANTYTNLLVPLVIMPLQGKVVAYTTEKVMMAKVKQFGLSFCPLEDTGICNYHSVICRFAVLMLFPVCTWDVIAAVVIYDVSSAIYTTYRLRILFNSDEDSAVTTPEESHTSALNTACVGMYMQQVTDICSPILFCVSISVIYYGGNLNHYYIYQCYTDQTYHTAMLFGAIDLAKTILILIVQYILLRATVGPHQRLLFLQCCIEKLHDNSFLMLFQLASVGALFTSCFFLKHDGIALLGGLETGVGRC